VKDELIVTGGTVLTMVPGADPIPDGAVAVRSREIVAVGPASDLAASFPDALSLYADGGLILPGFVNTHTHLGMCAIRGIADDLPLMTWLEEHIWPAERAMMDLGMTALGTRLAAAESLLAGVTCVCDMYFHALTVVEACREVGIRAVVPESLIDFPTPASPTPEVALARQRELLTIMRDDPLIVPAVAAHAPYSVSAANLVKEAELAEEFDAPLIIHVAETRWETEKIRAEKGSSPVKYLADLGILTERTVAAHCVHVDAQDLDLLLEFNAGVASNPVSNLKLSSGIAPLPQMISRGIKVGLGTDGAASNNTLDLLRDAQLAALLYKGVTGDPTCLPATKLAEVLTLDGARVLGLADRVGSLEPGKRADLVCIGLDRPHAWPVYNPFSHLAYAARAADVMHVVVDGRIVVQNRQLKTIDITALRGEAAQAAARVRAAL